MLCLDFVAAIAFVDVMTGPVRGHTPLVVTYGLMMLAYVFVMLVAFGYYLVHQLMSCGCCSCLERTLGGMMTALGLLLRLMMGEFLPGELLPTHGPYELRASPADRDRWLQARPPFSKTRHGWPRFTDAMTRQGARPYTRRLEMLVEKSKMGLLIGVRGAVHAEIQTSTGCEVFLLDQEGAPPGELPHHRLVILVGTYNQIIAAHNSICFKCHEPSRSPIADPALQGDEEDPDPYTYEALDPNPTRWQIVLQ